MKKQVCQKKTYKCRIQYRREYYLKNRDKILASQKKYYEKNKYVICHNTLNRYCFKSIEKIKSLYPDRINEYTNRYPFEQYADRYIKRELHLCKISPSQSRYADCYDAGMLAYLYSIHRCAAMLYRNVTAYIKKMVRIYIICALNIYNDERNLCQENNFAEIRLDEEYFADKY